MSAQTYKILLDEIDPKLSNNDTPLSFSQGVFSAKEYEEIKKQLGLDPINNLIALSDSELSAAKRKLNAAYPALYAGKYLPMLNEISIWLEKRNDCTKYLDKITDEIQNFRDINDSLLSSIISIFSIQPIQDPEIEQNEIFLDFLNTAVGSLAGFVPTVNVFQQSILFMVRAGTTEATGEGYVAQARANRLQLIAAKLHDALNDKFIDILFQKDKFFEDVCRNRSLLDLFSTMEIPASQDLHSMRRRFKAEMNIAYWKHLLPKFCKLVRGRELTSQVVHNNEAEVITAVTKSAQTIISQEPPSAHVSTIGILLHRDAYGRVIAPSFKYRAYCIKLVLGDKGGPSAELPGEILNEVIGDFAVDGTAKILRKQLITNPALKNNTSIAWDFGQLYAMADAGHGKYFVYSIAILADTVSLYGSNSGPHWDIKPITSHPIRGPRIRGGRGGR